MSFWSAIVLIVLIGSVASVLQSRHRARHGITTDMMGNETHPPKQQPDDANERALQREVEELRERVKVLERIATDDRQRLGLADEIEKLRDK